MKFKEFPKLSRFSRDIIISEKLDGTNSSICILNKELEEDLSDFTIIAQNDLYTHLQSLHIREENGKVY